MGKKQTLQGQYAGFISRLGGFLIDQVITVTVIAAISYTAAFLFLSLGIDLRACPAVVGFQDVRAIVCQVSVYGLIGFGILFSPLYFIILWALAGQTLGKAAMGVRIVRLDGQHMTIRTAIRRYLMYVVSTLALGLGFIWILVDDRRQAWHDKFADTCVVYSWEARQNESLMDRVAKRFEKRRLRSRRVQKELLRKQAELEAQSAEALAGVNPKVREQVVAPVLSTSKDVRERLEKQIVDEGDAAELEAGEDNSIPVDTD